MRAAVLACALVISGCAATQPTVMPDADYLAYAKHRTGIWKCGTSGRLDPELASLGIAYLDRTISSMTYDPQRFQQALNQAQQSQYSDSFCNEGAMWAHDIRRQININNQSVDAHRKAIQDAISSGSKQTHCNRIGTQVLCNTY